MIEVRVVKADFYYIRDYENKSSEHLLNMYDVPGPVFRDPDVDYVMLSLSQSSS
jgi:hypothetical protein